MNAHKTERTSSGGERGATREVSFVISGDAEVDGGNNVPESIKEHDPSECMAEYEIELPEIKKMPFGSASGAYVGNSSSMKVHLPDCGYAYFIHPDNFELFGHIHEALSSEYEECGWCLGKAREREYKNTIKSEVLSNSFGGSCVGCGANRGIQKAHIVPHRKGGIEVMPLCPNCHWNYDHETLTKGESKRIQHYLDSSVSTRC